MATDSTGSVSIRWTLGGAVGAQKLAARVSGIAKPVDVTATASIGRASKASFSAPTARGVAGKVLSAPATVTVTDAFGNPIVGATVAFTTAGGSVSQPKVKTDAKGRAATKWTFGSKVGTQTLTAAVSGTPARATLEADVAKAATAAAVKKPAGKAPATKPALAKPATKPPAKKSGPR